VVAVVDAYLEHALVADLVTRAFLLLWSESTGPPQA